MTTRAKLTVYSALATALAALCLTPLLTTKSWIINAFVVIAAVAASGAGLRRTPFYRWTVPLGQLLVLFVLLLVGFAGSTAVWGGVVPGPRSVHTLGQVLGTGLDDIQEYAIPAPPNPGLRLILVASVGLIAVVVDTVAVTYRRSALAGLPLLALYSVGNGLAGSGGSWIWFALAAGGYLVLLFAEGQDRVSRWGRVFRGSSRGTGGTGALSQGGQRVGVLALALALLLPVFLPRWDAGLIHGTSGPGSGKGSGSGGAASLDPLVTLEAAFNSPSDEVLLNYRMDGDQAQSTYLRTGSLDTFDGASWKLVSTGLGDLKNLPRPAGLTDADLPTIDGDFEVTDRLESAWLPVPYPAKSITVPNPDSWQVDALTDTVQPTKDKAIKGLKYQVSALDVRPTATELRTAPAAPAQIVEHYTELPRELPPVVAEKALAVTAKARTPYDKALALQSWFTGPEFTYDTKIQPGTGSSAIETFLRDRRGFCVHFASTMAAMARTLKIPARVAVGFTPGDAKGGNQFSVTGQKYHAWPELYFEGFGWTRFEPTKSRGVQPSYADPVSAPATAPTQQPTAAAQSTAPVAAPSVGSDCDPRLRRLGECEDRKKTAAGAHEESWLLSWQVLGTLAGILVLIALLLTPMFWRTMLRRRRIGPGGRRRPGGSGPAELTDEQVLAAWDELVDSAWDLGIPPDESRTPRSAARRISETAELDEASAAAAGRVALAAERVLYARDARITAPLAADVRTARDGLRAGAGRTGRTRAVLLPPSSAQLSWRISDAVLAARLAVRGRVSRVTGAVTGPVRRAWGGLRRRKGGGESGES
ncbi:transglutaminaseTgpA domain-containing protein [Kitasatospora sp. NPDC092286]|uniref:transglutaminase family protein n=1 Tax=Kitasatospora sp. NPDC092286 TaxID=3364087 RepID=UPI0037F281C6